MQKSIQPNKFRQLIQTMYKQKILQQSNQTRKQNKFSAIFCMSQKKITKQSDTEFICKLCDIIDKYPQIVNWSQQGDKMIIFNIDQMQSLILPQYFRHNNFPSFIRQLNMYDFHKLYKQNKTIAFENQFFKRGNENNFHFIQRRKKIKEQEMIALEFEKKNQSILKRLKKQPTISESIKQSIQSLMEFKYTAYENTKKIRKQLQNLQNQVKQCRSRKISQSMNQIKNDLLQQLKEQLRFSKQIDSFVQKQFLSHKENKPIIANQQQRQNSEFNLPFTPSDQQLSKGLIDCRHFASNHHSFVAFPQHCGFWSVNDIHSLHPLFYSGQNMASDMYLNQNAMKQRQNNQEEEDNDALSMGVLGEQQLEEILKDQPNAKIDNSSQKENHRTNNCQMQ